MTDVLDVSQVPGQVVSRTGDMMNQASGVMNRVFDNMKTYWQYWVIGALVFYIMFFCGSSSSEGFYNIDWDHLGSNFQSFGRASTLARLNDAVWKGGGGDCYPHGEFYVMRYTEPKGCLHEMKEPKAVRKGYFNSCGQRVN